MTAGAATKKLCANFEMGGCTLGATCPDAHGLTGAGTSADHTPESIARLPPKLRQRLVQRGILKEADVKDALEKAAAAKAQQAMPEASGARPGTAEATPDTDGTAGNGLDAPLEPTPSAGGTGLGTSPEPTLSAGNTGPGTPPEPTPGAGGTAPGTPPEQGAGDPAPGTPLEDDSPEYEPWDSPASPWNSPGAESPPDDPEAQVLPSPDVCNSPGTPPELPITGPPDGFFGAPPILNSALNATGVPGTPPELPPGPPCFSPDFTGGATVCASAFGAPPALPEGPPCFSHFPFAAAAYVEESPAYSMAQLGSVESSASSKAASPAGAPPSAFCKAPALDPPFQVMTLQERLAADLNFIRQQSAATFGGVAVGNAPAAPMPAAPAATAPVRTTYTSAPVINKEAVLKRKADNDGAEESDVKRQAVESPAEARAESTAEYQAPVWLYKDGSVTQLNAAAIAAAVPAPAAAALAPAQTVAAAVAPVAGVAHMPLPAGPPPVFAGPALPPGWVRVPHEGDYYFWNTTTQEVSWDHPALPKVNAAPESKPIFTEEYKVLWTDVGKLIGRGGINLKIIKESIGCDIKVPRQGGGGGKDGKGKDGKGKGKGKGKKGKDDGKGKGKDDEKGVGKGIGTGEQALTDDQFAKVIIQAESAHLANGGKRCLQVMLGYGRPVERALAELGVEVKMPPVKDEIDKYDNKKSKDGIDPMDPAAYSDTPVGNWGSGMPKNRGAGAGGAPRTAGPPPADSRQANAERC